LGQATLGDPKKNCEDEQAQIRELHVLSFPGLNANHKGCEKAPTLVAYRFPKLLIEKNPRRFPNETESCQNDPSCIEIAA
jgi:hypothetical protein